MNISEILKKRIAGVPVLYIAGAFVIVLAVLAWRMKPTTDITDEGADVVGDPAAASDLGGDAYGDLATQGTVTVVQQPAQTTPDPVEKTNDTWAKTGAEWIVGHPTQDLAVSGLQASSALNHYLQGQDLSYDEGRIVNAVIKEYGQPPEGVSGQGKVTTDSPAQKQFNNFPGTHTVKGANDNTPGKISILYYGTGDKLHVDKLVSANPSMGPSIGTYNVGAKIVVPIYQPPRYYTTTAAVNWPSEVAAKNGITYAMVQALNPTLSAPYKPGTKVRVY